MREERERETGFYSDLSLLLWEKGELPNFKLNIASNKLTEFLIWYMKYDAL